MICLAPTQGQPGKGSGNFRSSNVFHP